MSKVGFTGTRRGMSPAQTARLFALLTELAPEEFHHGDCSGADLEAFIAATILGIKTVSHPPANPALRAYTLSTERRGPKDYLIRNHDIVDETDLLIVAPRSNAEELRSGTWATFRYAMKNSKQTIVMPR